MAQREQKTDISTFNYADFPLTEITNSAIPLISPDIKLIIYGKGDETMNGIHTTGERKRNVTRIYTKVNLANSGIDIACITRINIKTSSPRLGFSAKWLVDMGFVSGALVQFLPEPHGMTFILCDENIHKYSELDRRTKEKGGALIQMYRHDYLQLTVSGSRLDDTGLIFGDTLIVRYEYGLIRMRKLSCNSTKLTTAHVIGKWLSEPGFVPDAVLTVDSSPGLITCTLHENGVQRTAELVKYARVNKLKLLQVQKQKYKNGFHQWFDIPPQCLEKAGFAPDNLLLAGYEYGTIKLHKPDFAALGF
jgi:hypothetical protein